MKNRTVYDVLDQIMEDYSYTIKKVGKKVDISGSVYIDKLDITVNHEKTFYYPDADRAENWKNSGGLQKVMNAFKEELKNKVVQVIKENRQVLTDDSILIKDLLAQAKELKERINTLEEELDEAKQRIRSMELEKIYPLNPYPWTTPNTNPWSTGITWETQIGDQPDWLDKNKITCQKATFEPDSNKYSGGFSATSRPGDFDCWRGTSTDEHNVYQIAREECEKIRNKKNGGDF